jgi:hypothetical protein
MVKVYFNVAAAGHRPERKHEKEAAEGVSFDFLAESFTGS